MPNFPLAATQTMDGTMHPMEVPDPNTEAYNVPDGQTFVGEGAHVPHAPPLPRVLALDAGHNIRCSSEDHSA